MTPRRRSAMGAGTVIFAGGGAWLPPHIAGADNRQPELTLTGPERILIAHEASAVPGLLDAIAEEQSRGNYVAGYLAYEAGAAFGLAVKDGALPDPEAAGPDRGGPAESPPPAWMAVYPPDRATFAPFLASPGRPQTEATELPLPSMLNVTYDEYAEGVARVRDYIAAGDTYQVNYTVRARFALRNDPLRYFRERITRHPVPYGAYLDLGDNQVISLSPELFLRRRGEILESRPMKGTRPRGTSAAADADLAHELRSSHKERAENLMIVDMVRNDLGRVCLPGTVEVPALFTIEPYRTVWQMSSTVTGRLLPEAGVRTILATAFPGASITGAPKRRTMEIIRELEKEPRGIYTGLIGLFVPGGDFTCNLCIRTLVHREGHCLLGVGSGVVWDSNAAHEYEETLTKAAFAFPRKRQPTPPVGGRSTGSPTTPRPSPGREPGSAGLGLFETMLLESGGVYPYLEDHLQRMGLSAEALGLPFDREQARAPLADLAAQTSGPLVVRLDLDARGSFTVGTRPLPAAPAGPVTAALSPFRTDPDDDLLRHKTTVRALYDREHRRAAQNGWFEILFLNRLDHVTEGTITNVFARFGDRWATPPPADGLLPGIWRARFMAGGNCQEHSLTLEELLDADEIVIGNSVRGALQVERLLLASPPAQYT